MTPAAKLAKLEKRIVKYAIEQFEEISLVASVSKLRKLDKTVYRYINFKQSLKEKRK